MKSKAWKDYQEEVAAFFRSLGLHAETDVRLKGIRTAHDVDVVVKFAHSGFPITWLVECKHWNSPVSKLHVLGLRQIVIDLGADRGIVLSESGFQSGAKEAADLTNVHLESLASLEARTKHEVSAIRMRDLFDRVETCKERYWAISKSDRIAYGLRPEVTAYGNSGDLVISYCKDVLSEAMRGRYPFTIDSIAVLAISREPQTFDAPSDVTKRMEVALDELEVKLDAAEAATGTRS